MSTTNYTTAATQANSTVTLATIGSTAEPWVFQVNPGGTFDLEVAVPFSTAAGTTGLTLGLSVANPNGADGSVVGGYMSLIPVTNAQSAAAESQSGAISVATNTTTVYSVTSSAAANTAVASFRAFGKNLSTNRTAVLTVQFATEVATSAATIAAGATAILTTS